MTNEIKLNNAPSISVNPLPPNITVSTLPTVGDPSVFYNVIEFNGRYSNSLHHCDNFTKLTDSILKLINPRSDVEIKSVDDMLVTFTGNRFQVVREVDCYNISDMEFMQNNKGSHSLSFKCMYPFEGKVQKVNVQIPDVNAIYKVIEQIRRAGIMVSEFGVERDPALDQTKSWIRTLKSLREMSDRLSFSLKKELVDDNPGLYNRRFGSLIRKNASAIYTAALAATYTVNDGSQGRGNSIDVKLLIDGDDNRDWWKYITDEHELPAFFNRKEYDAILEGSKITLIPSDMLR